MFTYSCKTMYFLIRCKLLSKVYLLFKNTSFAILNSALRKHFNKQVQLLTKLPNTHKLTKNIRIKICETLCYKYLCKF